MLLNTNLVKRVLALVKSALLNTNSVKRVLISTKKIMLFNTNSVRRVLLSTNIVSNSLIPTYLKECSLVLS